MKSCSNCKYEPEWEPETKCEYPRRWGKCKYPIRFPPLPAVFTYHVEGITKFSKDGSGVHTNCKTWEKKMTKRLTKKQKRMAAAVKFLTNYMVTYDKQFGYMGYSDVTFINDVLYGLGVAIDRKYGFSNGFAAFKSVLREHLKDDVK